MLTKERIETITRTAETFPDGMMSNHVVADLLSHIAALESEVARMREVVEAGVALQHEWKYGGDYNTKVRDVLAAVAKYQEEKK